jgi:hypothetical protein
MKLGFQPRKWLEKKAKAGNRGFPIGTVAFYGPDDRRATKVAVGIVLAAGESVGLLERWFTETGDVRADPRISAEIVAFLRRHQVRSVVMPDAILGCPHEEGVDYPDGAVCPQCAFWAGRDRWTGMTGGGPPWDA